MRPYTVSSGRAKGLRPSAFLIFPKEWGTKGVDGWQKAIEDVLIRVRDQMNFAVSP
jgi:hypothetical protein